MVEYIADKDGNNKADNFIKAMNGFSDETQDEVLAHLKSMFGDVDDIDLHKLFGK